MLSARRVVGCSSNCQILVKVFGQKGGKILDTNAFVLICILHLCANLILCPRVFAASHDPFQPMVSLPECPCPPPHLPPVDFRRILHVLIVVLFRICVDLLGVSAPPDVIVFVCLLPRLSPQTLFWNFWPFTSSPAPCLPTPPPAPTHTHIDNHR